MKMAQTIGRALFLVSSCLGPSTRATADIRVGPTVGASLSKSSSPLSLLHRTKEAFAGRTLLAGATVEVAFGARDRLSFDVALGPYHGDHLDSCGLYDQPSCQPERALTITRALQYGMQYHRTFGRGEWRPYLGGGLGVKRYSYEYGDGRGNVSPVLGLATGAERPGAYTLRVELRTLLVQRNPVLSKNQVEVQMRLTFLVPGRELAPRTAGGGAR